MSKGTSLQIVGLSEVELLELREQLSDSKMDRVRDEGVPKTQHGDLGLTAAAVIVTVAVVHGLSVWLAKRQVEDITTSNITYETLSDGTVRLNVSQMSRGKLSASPDAKVVQSLKTQLSDILPLNTKP